MLVSSGDELFTIWDDKKVTAYPLIPELVEFYLFLSAGVSKRRQAVTGRLPGRCRTIYWFCLLGIGVIMKNGDRERDRKKGGKGRRKKKQICCVLFFCSIHNLSVRLNCLTASCVRVWRKLENKSSFLSLLTRTTRTTVSRNVAWQRSLLMEMRLLFR
jgi:hypothetical protein